MRPQPQKSKPWCTFSPPLSSWKRSKEQPGLCLKPFYALYLEGHGSVLSDLRVSLGVFDDWCLFSGLRAMQPRDRFQDHSLRATPGPRDTRRRIWISVYPRSPFLWPYMNSCISTIRPDLEKKGPLQLWGHAKSSRFAAGRQLQCDVGCLLIH